MSEEEKPILDLPEKEEKPKTYSLIGYTALGILFIGVVMQMMHAPYWFLFMVVGMGIMTVRTTVIFIRKRRSFFEWSSFIGRNLLFLAVLLYFSGTTRSSSIFIPAFVAFLVGLIGSYIYKGKETSDGEDLDL